MKKECLLLALHLNFDLHLTHRTYPLIIALTFPPRKLAVMFVLHPDGPSSSGGSSESPLRANLKFWGKQFLFWAAIRTAYVFFGEKGEQKKISQ